MESCSACPGSEKYTVALCRDRLDGFRMSLGQETLESLVGADRTGVREGLNRCLPSHPASYCDVLSWNVNYVHVRIYSFLACLFGRGSQKYPLSFLSSCIQQWISWVTINGNAVRFAPFASDAN